MHILVHQCNCPRLICIVQNETTALVPTEYNFDEMEFAFFLSETKTGLNDVLDLFFFESIINNTESIVTCPLKKIFKNC